MTGTEIVFSVEEKRQIGLAMLQIVEEGEDGGAR
jgi:hypothetical protein